MKCRIYAAATLCAAAVVLTGCDSGPSGTYVPAGGQNRNLGTVIDKMEFQSGGDVDVTMMGQTVRAAYKVDGKKLVLTAGNNQAQVFALDDNGCINGGDLIGKYCKK